MEDSNQGEESKRNQAQQEESKGEGVQGRAQGASDQPTDQEMRDEQNQDLHPDQDQNCNISEPSFAIDDRHQVNTQPLPPNVQAEEFHQSNVSEIYNQLGPLTDANEAYANEEMGHVMEEDEDMGDEDMDSEEEEKEDGLQLGIQPRENSEAQILASVIAKDNKVNVILNQETEEQKNERKEKEAKEIKQKMGELTKRLFVKLNQGCNKDICFSKFCKKNPKQTQTAEWVKLTNNQKSLLTYCLQHAQILVKQENAFCEQQSVVVNSKNIGEVSEEHVNKLFDDPQGFASSFAILSHKDQDTEMKDETEPAQKVESQIAENAFIHSRTNLKPFDMDHETFKKFFEKAEEQFSPFDTEDEPGKRLKEAIKQLVKGIKKTFEFYANAEDIQDALLFASRSAFILLQLPQLYEMDWFDTFAEILDILNLANKRILQHRLSKKQDSKLSEANNNQNLIPSTWATFLNKDQMLTMIQKLQQLITLPIMMEEIDSQKIEKAVKTLDILNDANNMKKRKHRINYKEFHNDAINRHVQLRKHIRLWVDGKVLAMERGVEYDRHKDFTLCNYPWILDVEHKVDLLTYENEIAQHMQMHQNRRDIFAMFFGNQGGDQNPYLVLKVHRDNLIQDTLAYLVSGSITNYKKPLKIVFEGEPGIDEGGVRKEFFQLIIKELFDPNFGMFLYNEKKRIYWFNGKSIEPNINFELIGLIAGLAIYNNIILDIHFPMALYKMLVGQKTSFEDLKEWQPEVAQSLQYILDYNNKDMPLADALGIMFTIETESFGEKIMEPLKEGGEVIPVTEENAQEYVKSFVEYTFLKGCKPQFEAFKRGFFRAASDKAIVGFFKPEELEQVIIGSKLLDFDNLHKRCKYRGGFAKDHEFVIWFFQVLSELNEEQQRQFLQFSTGSDRSPVGGLGKLSFYLEKKGDDSDLLPEAHTCFNHLVIPQYASKDKLKEKLLLAIQNAEGFGII